MDMNKNGAMGFDKMGATSAINTKNFTEFLESVQIESTLIKTLEATMNKMTQYDTNLMIWNRVKNQLMVEYLEKMRSITPSLKLNHTSEKFISTAPEDNIPYDYVNNLPSNINFKQALETASLNIEGSEILYNYYKNHTKDILKEWKQVQIDKEFSSNPLEIMKQHMRKMSDNE